MTCDFNSRGRDKVLKEKSLVVKCWECNTLTKAERKADPDCSEYCCCEDTKDESPCDQPELKGIILHETPNIGT